MLLVFQRPFSGVDAVHIASMFPSGLARYPSLHVRGTLSPISFVNVFGATELAVASVGSLLQYGLFSVINRDICRNIGKPSKCNSTG